VQQQQMSKMQISIIRGTPMPSDRPSTIDRINSGLSSPAITVHWTVICEISFPWASELLRQLAIGVAALARSNPNNIF